MMSRWSLSISLGGVDVSANLTETVRIEAEESTARIASFTLKPTSGAVDVGDWIKAPVVIDFILNPGVSQVVTRLFTGSVNWPIYDPVTRLTTFECTDNLQGHFEAMTEAEILAAIPGGKFSDVVFGDREDGWQQAMDVLSTVNKSYDIKPDGVPSLTDWAAKATPDFTFTRSGIVDRSISLELMRSRELQNKCEITFQHRFSRLHHREHSFSWGTGFSFCEYYANSHELPTRDMIQSAAESAGWGVQNGRISFGTLPVSGEYMCNVSPVVWSISEELQNQLVTSASWTAVRRWTQTVTETYTLTVQEAGSIAKFGGITTEDGAGFATEYDDSQWDSSTDTTTPAFSVNALGDYAQDQGDTSKANNAIETLLQIASAGIINSHRQNFVTVDIPIEPTIDRTHTARIEAGTVTAQGKVFQLIHELDILSGKAITTVKVAVSKSGVGGSSDALTAPAQPSTQPIHAAPSNSTVLLTRLGNDSTAPNYDEAWTGFTGDYTVAQGGGVPTPEQMYPRRFKVNTVGIEDESRNEVTGDLIQTYNVQAPDETLVISA